LSIIGPGVFPIFDELKARRTAESDCNSRSTEEEGVTAEASAANRGDGCGWWTI